MIFERAGAYLRHGYRAVLDFRVNWEATGTWTIPSGQNTHAAPL